jgi:starch phosphorylase
MGEPHHMLVPGYGTTTVNILRLWRARATREFDFRLFDIGDYASGAVEQKVHSENISKVLYPNDNTPQGRELRLRQQYFFVACLPARHHATLPALPQPRWRQFPEKVVIQLNDTHPVSASRTDAPADGRVRPGPGIRPGRSPAQTSPTPATR